MLTPHINLPYAVMYRITLHLPPKMLGNGNWILYENLRQWLLLT